MYVNDSSQMFVLVNNNQQVLIPFAEKLHEETIALRDEIDKNEVCISFCLYLLVVQLHDCSDLATWLVVDYLLPTPL